MIILLKFLVLAAATLVAEAFKIDNAYRTPGAVPRPRVPRYGTRPLVDWAQAERQALIEGATQ